MDILRLATSNIPITESVDYSCVLTNNWTEDNHPIGYASVAENAHWTPPVVMAHGKSGRIWSPGEFASPGLELLAETGSTEVLETEIGMLQTLGLAGDLIRGEALFPANGSQQQALDTIALSPEFPYLTAVSMMAPSPDWFSGLESFCPRGPGGFWYESFEIATYPWDAGTESGSMYSIDNPVEAVQGPIVRLTKDTVPSGGILLDPNGSAVLPVATLSCKLASGTAAAASTTPDPTRAPTIQPTPAPSLRPTARPTAKPTTPPPPPPVLSSELEGSYGISGSLSIETVPGFRNGAVVNLPKLVGDVSVGNAPGPYLYLSRKPYSETRKGDLDGVFVPIEGGSDGGAFDVKGRIEQFLDEIDDAGDLEDYRNGSWIVWCRPFGVWIGGGSISAA